MVESTELMDTFAELGRKLAPHPEHIMEERLEFELKIRGYVHRASPTRRRCQAETRREWWNHKLAAYARQQRCAEAEGLVYGTTD